MKKILFILSAFVLMGMSDAERREEQRRIQEMVSRTVKAQTQPSPGNSSKINRVLKNSYTNCCTNPIYPKSIFRFPVKPPYRNSSQSFFGGIPRG